MHDRDDIDELPAFDRVVHQMALMSEPEMHVRGAEFPAHLIRWDKRAPGGAVREAGRAACRQMLAHSRPDAVRADQRRTALLYDVALSPRSDGSAFGMRDEPLDLR